MIEDPAVRELVDLHDHFHLLHAVTELDIACSADGRYVRHCAAMLHSVLARSREDDRPGPLPPWTGARGAGG